MVEASKANRSSSTAFRRGLMLYGSTAALAASLMIADGGIGPAMAQDIGPRISPSQAAQGNFVPSGGGTPAPFFQQRTATLDIVEIPRDVVLNWSTYDTAAPGGANGNSYVNFLPQGTELRFVGTGQDFTVVNRVFTTPDAGGAYRGVAFQGAVTSYLFNDGPSSNGPIAGNVWFYSPGGILATGTSSFNVGSLLLSTADLTNFSDFGSFRSVDFSGVADPFSSVILQTGARITLTQPGSSFAVIAPTIDMGGDAYVNGSVLYLSAIEGNLGISNDGSLFPSVTTFAAAGNRITHTGTTSGPASIGTDDFSIFDPQTIEFRTARDVGVLLSGTLGYEGASNASLGPNGSIVLSGGTVESQGNLALTSDAVIGGNRVELVVGSGESIISGGDANGGYSLTLDASEGKSGSGDQVAGVARLQIQDGGRVDVAGDLTLDADAYATEVGRVTFAQGGSAAIVMNGDTSSLTVGGGLSLSARARPFANCECSTPGSGSALGGDVLLQVGTGTINASSLSADAGAEAFSSFFTNAGAVTDGTGGSATVSLGNAIVDIDDIAVYAEGYGADGTTGVAGGRGIGGSASFTKGDGGSLTLGGLAVYASGYGGTGGRPNGDGAFAQRGGDAQGGSAELTLAQNATGLGYLDLRAAAIGGDGGTGLEVNAENGADGGAAMGGTAALVLSGADTTISGVSEGLFDVSGTGGDGGDGERDLTFAFQSGSGGRGGAGTGGNLTITAMDDATFAWDLGFRLGGLGGTGGNGGDGVVGNGPGNFGLGAVGGDAMGGSIAVIADGGLIAGNLDLDVQGSGGVGGQNGDDANGGFTGFADFGTSNAGDITLRALDNGASRFDVGFANLTATGDLAGVISILDETSDPAASMRFGSLTASSSSFAPGSRTTFQLTAANNPIQIDGTADIYGDIIALEFAGTGRLVAESLFVGSNSGGVSISHSGNPGLDTIDTTGAINIFASGPLVAGPGTVLHAGDFVYLRADGSIEAADTRGANFVTISALTNVTVGNVGSFGTIELFAGRVDIDGVFSYLPGWSATATGTVTTNGSLLVESGGFAQFAPGSSILSDGDIRVRTGDDIVVAPGASLVSDRAIGVGASTFLLAGDINVGPNNGDLEQPITTPIASLILAGSIETNGHALVLSGDAIDGTGSTIRTGTLTADVTDAPEIPPYSNDGGILTNGCFQGSACLGNVTATGNVAIGQASNNGLISLRTGAFVFSGANFDVTTFESLEIGADGTPASLNASNRIALRSFGSSIGLYDLAVSAPDLQLYAGSDLLADTSSLTSANSILINVGNDLRVGTIDTGGVIFDGSDAVGYYVPGNFIARSLYYRGGSSIDIATGAALSVDFADASSGSVTLAAGGAVFLGQTPANTAAIDLSGTSATYLDLASVGSITINASGGDLAGGDANSSAGDISFVGSSSGLVGVGLLTAAGDVTVSGADVFVRGAIAGGALSLTADGTGSIDSFTAGTDASFAGSDLLLGVGTAGGSLFAQTETGNIAFTSLAAVGDAVLDAAALIDGGSIAADGNLSLLGADLSIDEGSGALGVSTVVSGTASFVSLASETGAVAVTAGSSIAGGNVAAATDARLNGPDVLVGTVTAGRDITVNAISASASLLDAGRDIAVITSANAAIAAADAGSGLLIDAGAILGSTFSSGLQTQLIADTLAQVTSAAAGTSLSISSGGAVQAGSLSASNAISVNGNDAVSIDAFTSGGDTTLYGATLALTTGSAGGDLVAQTLSGNLTFSDLSATGDADLYSEGALLGGDVAAGAMLNLFGTSLVLGDAAGGAGLTASASSDTTFTSLSSSAGAVRLDGSETVEGGSIAAATSASLTAGNASLTNIVAGNGVTISVGSLDIGNVTAGTDISADVFGNANMGDVTAGGDIVSYVAGNLAANDLTAGGLLTLSVGGDATLRFATSGLDMTLGASSLRAQSLDAGGALSVSASGSAATDAFSSGTDADFSAGSLGLGTGSVGGNLTANASDGALAYSALDISGNADLFAWGEIRGGSIAAGGTLTLFGSNLLLGTAFSQGAMSLRAPGNIAFTGLTGESSVLVSADGNVAGGSISAMTTASLTGTDVSIGDFSAGTDLDIVAAALLAENLSAGGAFAITTSGDTSFGSGTAGTTMSIAAGSLSATTLGSGDAMTLTVGGAANIGSANAGARLTIDAGSLSANVLSGTVLDVAADGAATVNVFSAGSDAAFVGGSLALGTGSVGGDLSARTTAGTLGFTALNVTGDAVLQSAGALAGGNVAAGGFLTLSGTSLTLGAAQGASGIAATTPGNATFTSLASSGGNVSLDAGGAVAGTSASAAGGIDLAGASVNLGSASFGGGLTLLARSGAISGTGLYSGTGQVMLTAAQGIGIGSVDTLGGITLDAGAEARFVELRSRDGSVAVNAGGSIVGSTVAATGNDPAGEDNVALVADGDITLNGSVTTLNLASRAQDDLTAQAGGMLAVAGVQAGRDLALNAGSGLLTVVNPIAGRDITLIAPELQVSGVDAVRNLAATATAGDLIGTDVTAGGNGSLAATGTLDVDGVVAGGVLSLDGGTLAVGSASGTAGLTATSAGDAAFTSLASAAGAVSLSTAFGAVNGGSLDAATDISLSGGAIVVSNLTAGGSLSVDGETILGDIFDAGNRIGLSIMDSAAVSSLIAGADVAMDVGSGTFGSIDAGANLDVASPGAVGIDSFAVGGSATINASSLRIGTGSAGGSIAAFADAEDFSFGTLSASGDIGLGAQTVLSGDTATAGGSLVMTTTDLVLGRGFGSDFVWTMAVDGGSFQSLASDTGSITLTSWGLVNGGDLDAATYIQVAGAGNSIFGAMRAGTDIDVTAGTLRATSIDAGGEVTILIDDTLQFGSANAGTDLSLAAMSIAGGTARAGGVLVATGDGSVRLGSADAAGDLRLEGGMIDVDAARTGGVLVAAGDGSVRIGDAGAAGDLTVDGGTFDIGTANAGESLFLLGDGSVRIGTGAAGAAVSVRADSLDVESLRSGTALDVSVTALGDIAAFQAGAGATIAGGTLSLGQGLVTGDLAASTNGGDLGFANLSASGAVDLNAAQALTGGNAQAGGTLSLRGARITMGSGTGAAGVSAQTPGALGFATLSSRDGDVAAEAGGAITGGSATAASNVSVVGASVALDNAGFGNGLTLTARTADLTGAGLYQGTGAATLSAAQGIAIGSVDTLGDIAMDAGAAARFVELRSRDGSVGVNAGSDITGSSAAALGSAPAGDDSVRFVAGGAIALDGGSTALNPRSFAQDDFIARAGTTLNIVGVEAGRDLSLTAGSGTLAAANLITGRDLSLTAQAVDLDASTIAGNLTVRATAGDITGSGLTTAGGAVDLGASGSIAIGSLVASGGSLIANAGGSFDFAELTATGDVRVSARLGLSGSGDIFATNGVFLSTVNGATTLRDIRAGGMIDLSGGGTLALRDVSQTGAGSLTIAYDGDIVLRDVRGTNGVSIEGGASLGFGSIAAPGAIAIEAAGAVSGDAIDTSGGIAVMGARLALGTVTGGEGDVALDATMGDAAADSISGGAVRASANGGLSLGTVAASGTANLSGASVTLGTATVGSDLAIESAGAIGFGAASAGRNAALTAGGPVAGGPLSADGAAVVSASDLIAINGLDAASARLASSGGVVTATGIVVDGLLDASGTAVTLDAPGQLRVLARASAGDIGITSGGDLRVDATATGAIALASTGGSVIIGNVGQSENTGTGIGAEAVDGGAGVSVNAANAIQVLDSVAAGGALTMDAGGLVDLVGAARGQTIALTAGDLAIGANGALGDAGTQRISLASTNAVNLGTGVSGGFAVDAGEFGRILSGGDLMVSALAGTGNGAGSITVGALTVNSGSGGQVGANGTFGLTSAGLLDVNNTLSIARAGTGNTLMLTGDAVDLDYANAALSVLDSASASTGRIIVNGRLITSLSASAAADIVGKTPDEISLRLGQADIVREIGLFRTSNLTLQGVDRILIQNSGGTTVDARRGLSVGALTVTGRPDGGTLVVINGVIGQSTGNQAAQVITLTNPLAAGSSFNGCGLANAAACLVIPPPPPPAIVAPISIVNGTSDLIQDEDDQDSEVEDGVADGKPEAPPIDTTKIDDPAGQPMIDDPVTGAGNEDLWQPQTPQ